MNITLLKPCQQKRRSKAWHQVFADGREILNLQTKRGRAEYDRRTKAMWDRQGQRCALVIHLFCKENRGKWQPWEIFFDHELLRGVSRQDDRIEVDGKPLNHAVCGWCNSQRGSQKWDAVSQKEADCA
jgi:hypothetical protein